MADPSNERMDDASGVELLRAWTASAANHFELLPRNDGDEWLALGERSVLGAVVRETGGILVDHGWLRILGSGSERLPRTLLDWNLGRTTWSRSDVPKLLLVADDVVGGFFAIDWGGLGGSPGEINYFAPDSLRWEPMNGFQYAEFVRWALIDDLDDFYDSLRWPSWRAEIQSMRADQALSIIPHPWTSEGKRIEDCSRRPVPVEEVFSLNVIDFPRQLGDQIPACLSR